MFTTRSAATVFRIGLQRQSVLEARCGGRAIPKTAPTTPLLQRCYSDLTPPHRAGGHGGDNRRFKLGKKLFSTVLFGSTLAAALYFRRRRQAEHNELFRECVMLPRDGNYAANVYFYNYRGYVFPGMVIKSLPKVQALKARPDDIFVVSFPKT
ncbi:hypothetical protein V5799_025759, partial [Amblyomma americanum]